MIVMRGIAAPMIRRLEGQYPSGGPPLGAKGAWEACSGVEILFPTHARCESVT